MDRGAAGRRAKRSRLRRRDGASVYTVAGAQLFTTRAVIEAERQIMTAAALTGGRTVDTGDVGMALLESHANGITVNRPECACRSTMASTS